MGGVRRRVLGHTGKARHDKTRNEKEDEGERGV